MKLKHLIYGALFLGAFSLSSCDKDEVVEASSTAEEIIEIINQKHPYIIIQQGQYTNGKHSEYELNGYWLITYTEEIHDYVSWNLNYITHFEWMERSGTLRLHLMQP